jgi:hypothetical protein
MGTSTSSPSVSGTDRVVTPPSSNARLVTRARTGLATGLAVAVLGGVALPARQAWASDPPSVGDCLMAAEASLKLRADHKLRLTRTQLAVCSSPSCPAEVRQECMHRIDEVNAASPTIVLAVKDRGGHDVSAVKVTVDGQFATDHIDGSAMPIDPGPHEFTFETAGAPPLTETVILHEGEKDRRETVTLALGAGPQPAAGGTSAGAMPGDAKPATSGKGQRVAGIVVGAVGIAGLGVGGLFGVIASSSWSTAKRECPTGTGCSPQAISDRSSAVTGATISTVGFIAGGVLLAGGLTLFFTAPKGDAPRVGLEARPNGFAVNGEF